MSQDTIQFAELKKDATELLQQFDSFWRRLDFEKKQNRLQELEHELSKTQVWNNPELFTPLLQEKSILSNWVQDIQQLRDSSSSLREWLELAEAEQDQELYQATQEQMQELQTRLRKVELKTLLSAEEDQSNAILEIHPGAGGTEAQDWGEMLLRMYKRWAENHDYQVSLLDYLPGDEAGLKSAVLNIEGSYAYGLLKSEKGIHRLIRLSPYDTSGRRHTSFASVDVYPDVGQDIEIDIQEKDLRIDVFRSSGPGGQSVNKTSSAVRITHIPTEITVQCQNEKSQHRNKDAALKILRARLYDLELEKIEKDKQLNYAQKSTIAWGSQIRSYTLQPYRLVKDHRTGTENSNVDKVLDGDLDEYIRNYLIYLHGQKNS
ncbi:MAG: peptide chain release factor 2 [Desulfohalobiaceae bacterium]